MASIDSSASSQNIAINLRTGEPVRNLPEFCFEQPPKRLLGPKELRLDRAKRQIQRLGQVVVLDAAQIVSRDQQAVVSRQPGDSLFEPLAQLDISKLPVEFARPVSRP